MKLFERTGGYYLFWISAIYLAIGLPVALYYKDIGPERIQLVWLVALSMPFWCPAFGRWLNMSIEWDKKMFDWFKKDKLPSNVVPFPEPKVVPPAPVKEPTIFYTFGLTDDNRLSFRMGYTTLTMNREGVQGLIDQLEFFKNQLETESTND